MEPVELQYPIHTIDRKRLFDAGALLSEEVLDELIAGLSTPAPEPRPLLSLDKLRNDILSLFDEPNYHIVFSDENRNRQVMELLDQVKLVPPVLASLDYFRVLDIYTYRHILLVMMLTALLAQELLEDASEQLVGAMVGPMHDIGKICIPLEILQKTAPLNQGERCHLEHHALAGYALLAYYLRDPRCLAARSARDHHERRDGSGYPRGIRLQDTMVEIIVACDVFDALTSPRPYRPQSFDTRSALEVLADMAEKGALDHDVVRALVGFNRKWHPCFRDCELSQERRGTPPSENVYGVCRDNANRDE